MRQQRQHWGLVASAQPRLPRAQRRSALASSRSRGRLVAMPPRTTHAYLTSPDGSRERQGLARRGPGASPAKAGAELYGLGFAGPCYTPCHPVAPALNQRAPVVN